MSKALCHSPSLSVFPYSPFFCHPSFYIAFFPLLTSSFLLSLPLYCSLFLTALSLTTFIRSLTHIFSPHNLSLIPLLSPIHHSVLLSLILFPPSYSPHYLPSPKLSPSLPPSFSPFISQWQSAFVFFCSLVSANDVWHFRWPCQQRLCVRFSWEGWLSALCYGK